MFLSQLLTPGGYRSSSDASAVTVGNIVADTRKITVGCVFVCLRGRQFDAHTKMKEITDAGAAAIVAEKMPTVPPNIPVFLVPDTRAEWAKMWSRFCGEPEKSLIVIGITGTNGKTTTAMMIAAALREGGKQTGLIGTAGVYMNGIPYTFDSPEGDTRSQTMTTPDPDILFPLLRKMKESGITHVVMETSSHALEMKRCSPIRFEAGVFTNLSPEHLDQHGDMERYCRAKETLFRQCVTGIVNLDDPYATQMMRGKRCRFVTCGKNAPTADYRAKDIRYEGIVGSDFIIESDTEQVSLHIRIPGDYSVENALIASVTARVCGIGFSDIRRAIGNIPGVPGRMERISEEALPFSVFIDYAHTAEALRKLLITIRSVICPGERITLLFGCGGDRDKSKRKVMAEYAEQFADKIIVTSDNPRTENPAEIIRDILSGFREKAKPVVIEDRKNAIEYAVKHAEPGEILLLVGKGHETYQLIGSEKIPFDEKEIVREALGKRKDYPHESRS